jgi:hypothetical protein
MKAYFFQAVASIGLTLGLISIASLGRPANAATISTDRTSFENSLQSGFYLETFDLVVLRCYACGRNSNKQFDRLTDTEDNSVYLVPPI